jgi:hypothetical protein
LSTIATVANAGMTLGSDLNSLENGGGAVAAVQTVEDASAANTAVDNADSGNNAADLANTLGQVNSMVGQAENGGTSGGGTTPNHSTAACSNDPTYTVNMNECRSNTLSQAPCYRAAAALCQCYIDKDPTNPNRSQWQQCVTNNTSSANSLMSNAPTVGR